MNTQPHTPPQKKKKHFVGTEPKRPAWEVRLLDRLSKLLFANLIQLSSTILQLAESAKAQFSHDYSDHLALVRAYEGWIDAEKDLSGYEYCWKNFLSVQSMKAIDSLQREFFSLLKETGLVDSVNTCNGWAYDQHLVRAIICAGLYPGICSVVVRVLFLLFYILLFCFLFFFDFFFFFFPIWLNEQFYCKKKLRGKKDNNSSCIPRGMWICIKI